MTLPPQASQLLGRLARFGVRLGLDSTRRVLATLGDPHAGLPVVLVGGTNGKGSTAAILAAIGSAAGYRTGLYTSPHLEAVEERIRIDGRAIPGSELGELLAEVVPSAKGALGHLPTYFEALTAAAFSHFARQRVELAVLEVGMGGRLDATNLSQPAVSLITEIGLEHRSYLGDTLAAIAREKAGILRAGRPAFAWTGRPAARRALQEAAAEIGAELRLARGLVRLRGRRDHGWHGQEVTLRTPSSVYRLGLGLGGEHQIGNLSLAVLAAETLSGAGWPRLTRAAIEAGVAAAGWPGRLEPVALPGGRRCLLDAAHNPDGARCLCRFLERHAPRYTLLFGALSDKEVGAILPPLARGARRLVLTRPDSDRAVPAAALRAQAPASVPTAVVERVEEALSVALAEEPELLVVCGSIYLVGEVRTLLRRRFGVPPPAAAPLRASGGWQPEAQPAIAGPAQESAS